MATLLAGPGWDGRDGRDGRDDRDGDLVGRLDPLTLATYRWRVANNAYDAPEVLDALANSLAAIMLSDFGDGVEWRGLRR
jgi:hypothetical protein